MLDINKGILSRRYLFFAGIVAALLYLSGFGSIFFLIPYAWILTLYPPNEIVFSVSAQIVTMLLVRIIQSVSIVNIFGELLVMSTLLCALVSLRSPFHYSMRSFRALYRILIITALFMIVSLPLVYRTAQNPAFIAEITATIQGLLQDQDALLVDDITIPQLIHSTLRTICSVYAVFYFIIPVISWWFVQTMRVISPRLFFRRPTYAYALEYFSIPRGSIWGLIICIGLLIILMNYMYSIMFYFLTNSVAILTILYAMQGVAILMRIFMRRYTRTEVLRAFIIISCIILFIPLVNVILILAVFVLGVSRTWVDFDRFLTRHGSQ